MYYPQTYHHIQEIQKYNIQDYRPRYVTFAYFLHTNMTNSSQDGAIPKSNPQSAPSPAHAQTTWLRILASRRVANARITSLRHHTRTWSLRRDGEFEAEREMMKLFVLCIMLGYSTVQLFETMVE
jgi:hypothetical protein